jgi:hypothetical protein
VIAIGAHGAMVVVAGTKETTIDPPDNVTLTAGCATSDGHLWVASGTHVYRRRDAL